jgi:ferredoxin--NADP+ reductase
MFIAKAMTNRLLHTSDTSAASKHLKGRITSRRNVSSTLWVITVRPEKPIPFIPGQYVTIGLAGDSKIVERPYSLASSPREPELEFFVELVVGGEFTPLLYGVPVGGEVYLRPAAKGRFVYDDQSGRLNHLMIATLTGVAPFVSMVRDFVARAKTGERFSDRIVLLHAASMAGELAYDRELKAIVKEQSWFHYVPTISRIWLDPDWHGERGRVEDIVRKYQDSFGFRPANATAYVCGSPNLIENVRALLNRAGFAPEAIREEMFWLPENAGLPSATLETSPALESSPPISERSSSSNVSP